MKNINNKNIYITTILLSLIGTIMIYSSSSIWSNFKYGTPYKYVISQGIFVIIGIIIMKIFSKIDYQIYKKYSNTFLCI